MQIGDVDFSEKKMVMKQAVCKKAFGEEYGVKRKKLYPCVEIKGLEKYENLYLDFIYYRGNLVNVQIYEDLGTIAYPVSGRISTDYTVDELAQSIESYDYLSYEGIKRRMKGCVKKGLPINATDLLVLDQMNDKELAAEYRAYNKERLLRRLQ